MNKKQILNNTVATLLLTAAGNSQAVDFGSGDVQGAWDTTLTYGIASRLEDPDKRIIGFANGGTAYGVNSDDGDLNYDKGVFSNAVKLTSELELSRRNLGGFIRATAFYDYENKEGERKKAKLTDEAQELMGSDVDLLDAYLWSQFELGTKPAEVRLGNQVLSWGESTFIQNSINTINPVDVNKLRVPGAELREALEPVPMVSASLAPTDNTSLELFYQLRWRKTVIDPPGSYFSTNDFAGEGGSRVMLGWGQVPDTIAPNVVVGSSTTVVARGPDQEPEDDGQYGLAMRFLVPQLNDTEFGVYYINYHSRLPLIGATTGSAAAAIGGTYVQDARYFISYPEDIKLYGLSFNTSVGRSGVALQGEVSYRQDVPLQIDDIEILFAALGAQDNLSPGATPAAPLAQYGQLGLVSFNTDIPGYIRRDVAQAQVTATKVFGPGLGADSTLFLTEIGVTSVVDMPEKGVLRLNGPGTFMSGNAALSSMHDGIYEGAEHFADPTSWGYRMLFRMQFNNAFGSTNLAPRLVWQHDVAGISPGPGGNFVEGRRAATLGLSATYRDVYSADISYTTYDGAGRYNLINDRDFVAANIKYSF